MKTNLGFLAAAVLVAAAARAGSTIDPAARHGYGANLGWTDWQHDTAAPDGVTVEGYLLHGKIYAANVGWIDTGDGAPAGGVHYAQSGGEWGVNHDGAGNLSGYAYGANIGWIVFDSSIASPPRVDLATGKMTGYAYGANVGWIGLDGITTTFGPGADSDGDGIADGWEYEMLAAAGLPADLATLGAAGDSDGDGTSDADEHDADTDPFDPEEVLRITNFVPAAGSAGLQWTHSPRRIYQVRCSSDLSTWWPEGAPTLLDAATVPTGGATRMFFKVEATRP
jgi:hypothetical protein